MAATLPSRELLSKMNALLTDPNYTLPDDISEANRTWIRTGINMMANELPNPAISVADATSRTIRAPHGGRKTRKQKKQRKQKTKQKRKKTNKNI